MKRGQLFILVLAAAAVAIIAVVGSGGKSKGEGDGGGSSSAKAPAGAVRVTFAYSPEKEVLLKQLIDRFNASATKVNGKPVFVEASIVASGDAETKIARGTLKPVVWSPASSLWGRLLNFEADAPLTADANPSIVRTPLVIAMWEPMARALGWPKKKLGFADVLKLSTSGKGWAAFG